MTEAVQAPASDRLVSQLTVKELRALWREDMRALLLETRQDVPIAAQEDTNGAMPSLDDFPVDDVGPWPEGLSLRREDMYDDDGR